MKGHLRVRVTLTRDVWEEGQVSEWRTGGLMEGEGGVEEGLLNTGNGGSE